jgi:zinc protease
VLAVVEAGATRDPVGKHGLAVLTGRALAEGTATMTALELAERTESLGTVLDTGADWDSSIVQLTALRHRAADAFAVLAEVLRRPSFPANEMQRLVEERLSDLTQIRAEPRGLADVALNRLLYAPTSRFAKLAGGDERSVASITREDVVQFHAEHFRPGATALLVVGDCTPDEAVEMTAALPRRRRRTPRRAFPIGAFIWWPSPMRSRRSCGWGMSRCRARTRTTSRSW